MRQLPDSRVLFDEAEISAAVDGMAAAIGTLCDEGEWILVCVLNGGLVVAGELMKRVDADLRLETLRVTRYHETVSGFGLKWHTRPASDLRGKRILLVDDIFDEGKTLTALVEYLLAQGVQRVVTAVLLDKSHDRKSTELVPDVVGLTCPDHYVFGYGMDFKGRFRNLPVIRCLTR